MKFMFRTRCLVCQDEHCIPWQRQREQSLVEELPEITEQKVICYPIEAFEEFSTGKLSLPVQWQCATEHLAVLQQLRLPP